MSLKIQGSDKKRVNYDLKEFMAFNQSMIQIQNEFERINAIKANQVHPTKIPTYPKLSNRDKLIKLGY